MSIDEEDRLFQEVVHVSTPRRTIKLIAEGSMLQVHREDLRKIMDFLNVKE